LNLSSEYFVIMNKNSQITSEYGLFRLAYGVK